MKSSAQPLVSIIMTTYNRYGLLRETIESILAQTFKNWELLIADDGSDDDTRLLALQYNDPRIIYLYFEHCGIGGRLKNLALKRSKGEMIAFIDSDDLWESTKLEKQLRAMESFPGAGFCVTGGYNFLEKNKPVDFFYPQKSGQRYGNLFNAYFQSQLSGFTQALLVKRKMIEALGGFREEKSFSDVDLIASLACHFPGIILYEPLVFRRLHNSNYITNNWEKSYEEGIELIKSYRNRLPGNIYRNALHRLYINYGEKWLALRSKPSARKKFLLAWKQKPLSIIPLRKLMKTVLRH